MAKATRKKKTGKGDGTVGKASSGDTGTAKAAERKQAMSDYDDYLARVMELKSMTDTKSWQRMFGEIMSAIDRHGKSVLVAEKNRDVIRHQEGVKILRGVIAKVREPVDELNNFIHNMPLFSAQMKTRASWNEALGRVELNDAED